VSENSGVDYNCRAYYTDGTSLLVEPDIWEVDCSYAGISATGLLTAYDVDVDQACQIAASYIEGGITLNVPYDITITDSADSAPPPTDIINNLTVSSGKVYEVVPNALQEGASAYIDRTYTFTYVPGYLEGTTYIKTANDDKGFSSRDFLSFEVTQNVTVYVAHDDRSLSKPTWLLEFTDTGDQLATTDTTLSIFARDFPAGTITLGGNQNYDTSM